MVHTGRIKSRIQFKIALEGLKKSIDEMKNYQVTIGYKAVITVDLKAENEKDAKEIALDIMKNRRDKMYNKSGFDLQDDSFAAHGIVDMDETWNMVQN